MDKKLLLRQRKQLARARDAEFRACLSKWRRKIDSADRRLSTALTAETLRSQTKRGKASRAVAIAHALEGKANGERQKAMMTVVQHILQHKWGFFTAKALVELINKSIPLRVTERDVSIPLQRLQKLGEIKLIERGRGRKPHMYLKP